MMKDEIKKKYAEEFNPQDTYKRIVQRQKERRYRQGFMLAVLIVTSVLAAPYVYPKKDVQFAYDQIRQELGPEIELNINLVSEDMKVLDAASALAVDMQMKQRVLQEHENTLFENLCPEGWIMSDVVCMTMINKGTDEVMMNYDFTEMTAGLKSIRLMASYDQYPFRCYALSPDEAVSKIDGIEMKISYRSDLELYLCLFQVENLYFDVECSHLNEHELIDFLVNLIKKVREDS